MWDVRRDSLPHQWVNVPKSDACVCSWPKSDTEPAGIWPLLLGCVCLLRCTYTKVRRDDGPRISGYNSVDRAALKQSGILLGLGIISYIPRTVRVHCLCRDLPARCTRVRCVRAARVSVTRARSICVHCVQHTARTQTRDGLLVCSSCNRGGYKKNSVSENHITSALDRATAAPTTIPQRRTNDAWGYLGVQQRNCAPALELVKSVISHTTKPTQRNKQFIKKHKRARADGSWTKDTHGAPQRCTRTHKYMQLEINIQSRYAFKRTHVPCIWELNAVCASRMQPECICVFRLFCWLFRIVNSTLPVCTPRMHTKSIIIWCLSSHHTLQQCIMHSI